MNQISTRVGNQLNKNPEKDSYGTCKISWDTVLPIIPKNKKIWQPFYMDGECSNYLREKGYNVIHENKNFFEYEPDDYELILDNPPFSNKGKLFERLHSLNKPFIIFYPLTAFTIKSFTDFDKKYNYKIISPNLRFKFYKGDNIYRMGDVILICYKIDFIDFGPNKFNYDII